MRKRDNPFYFSLEGGCGLELGRAVNPEHEDDQRPQGQTQQERPEHPFLGIGKLHVPINMSFRIGDMIRVHSGPPVPIGPAILTGPSVGVKTGGGDSPSVHSRTPPPVIRNLNRRAPFKHCHLAPFSINSGNVTLRSRCKNM